MAKTLFNLIVDILSLAVILAMAATGLVVRFLLPPGTGGRHGGGGSTLWSLGRHDWGDVHYWLAVGLGGLLVVHVALHWQWICAVVRRTVIGRYASRTTVSRVRRSLWGVGFVLVVAGLLTAFYAIAASNVVSQDDNDEPQYRNRQGWRAGR